jgi:putative membrane protein
VTAYLLDGAWTWHDGMGWWMVFGGVFWLLLLGAVVYLIVSAAARGPSRGEGSPDAREIARRRYARGEIGREEFERLMKDLEVR